MIQISKKVADIVISVLLVGLGIYLYIKSGQLADAKFSQIGSSFFPRILAVGLIILPIINIAKTVINKEKDEKIVIPNHGKVWLTIVIIALFLYSWIRFGFFFVQAFLFTFILLTIYRLPLGLKMKNIAVNLAVSGILVGATYLIFDYFMYIQF